MVIFIIYLLLLFCLFSVIIVGLVFINCVSVKWSSRLINTLTITKVIGLLVLIITGLVYICKGEFYTMIEFKFP